MEEKLDLEILSEIGRFTTALRRKVRIKCEAFEYTAMSQIIEEVEGEIFNAGYLPAFPCAISVNNVAAHNTFFDEDYTFEEGDVIKVDFGASSNGFCTDCAFTFEYKTSKYHDLLKANEKALDEQIETVDIGVLVSELGNIAETNAKDKGFGTIHELSGHQIGKNTLHCGTSVPNYDNGSSKGVTDNMELAIEPYFTMGGPQIKESFDSNILHLRTPKNTRDILGRKILKHVREYYPHLPFSKRWLVTELMAKTSEKVDAPFSKSELLRGLKVLIREGIIYEYPALVSADGSINSQFEDTVVFVDGKKVVITRLE